MLVEALLCTMPARRKYSNLHKLVRHICMQLVQGECEKVNNLRKIAASGVDSRVVVQIREFLIGRSQRVRAGWHYEVRVPSGIPQGSVLGPLLFLADVNNIWRNFQ